MRVLGQSAGSNRQIVTRSQLVSVSRFEKSAGAGRPAILRPGLALGAYRWAADQARSRSKSSTNHRLHPPGGAPAPNLSGLAGWQPSGQPSPPARAQ
jgi:hypothetical protein